MKKSRAILLILIPFAFLMMTSFGGRHHSNYDKPEGWNLEAMDLADGTYQGTAAAFREGLTVEVIVEDGVVTEISVVDHSEVGAQYYKRPIDTIPGLIVEVQNTEVDGVTGATATSMGIMSAVENALEQAEK